MPKKKRKTKSDDTTTIRVTKEARAAVRQFADDYGLKMGRPFSKGLINALETHPELFLPKPIHHS